jgi:hypothetical protein
LLSRDWQRANPDLRIGDPSADWAIAYDEELKAAAVAWPKVRTPTLLIGLDICAGRPNCRRVPEFTRDRAADPHATFIGQVLAFIDPDRAGLAPAPAAATVEPES